MKKAVNHIDKKTKIEFAVILALGVFFIAVGLGLLFGLYRPFVPWQKYEGVDYIRLGDFDCLYRFTVDGQLFEVIAKNYAFGSYGGAVLGSKNHLYKQKQSV